LKSVKKCAWEARNYARKPVSDDRTGIGLHPPHCTVLNLSFLSLMSTPVVIDTPPSQTSLLLPYRNAVYVQLSVSLLSTRELICGRSSVTPTKYMPPNHMNEMYCSSVWRHGLAETRGLFYKKKLIRFMTERASVYTSD